MHPLAKSGFRIFLFLGLIWLFFPRAPWNSTAAKQATESTPTATPILYGPFITVTYIEPINVRTGPSSFDYPVIGSIPVGGTAPALGRSPASEWIQISFAAGPHGVGWVYAANVSLSANALLPVVEPPPTAVPAVIATANPTFVAAFQVTQTATRLPTFTAPPPLVIPTYNNPVDKPSGGIQTGWVIIGLALIGLVGVVISSFRRR